VIVFNDQFHVWEYVDIPPAEPQPEHELVVAPCSAWGAWLRSEWLRQQINPSPEPVTNRKGNS
jgi:hypothetical protein